MGLGNGCTVVSSWMPHTLQLSREYYGYRAMLGGKGTNMVIIVFCVTKNGQSTEKGQRRSSIDTSSAIVLLKYSYMSLLNKVSPLLKQYKWPEELDQHFVIFR